MGSGYSSIQHIGIHPAIDSSSMIDKTEPIQKLWVDKFPIFLTFLKTPSIFALCVTTKKMVYEKEQLVFINTIIMHNVMCAN